MDDDDIVLNDNLQASLESTKTEIMELSEKDRINVARYFSDERKLEFSSFLVICLAPIIAILAILYLCKINIGTINILDIALALLIVDVLASAYSIYNRRVNRRLKTNV